MNSRALHKHVGLPPEAETALTPTVLRYIQANLWTVVGPRAIQKSLCVFEYRSFPDLAVLCRLEPVRMRLFLQYCRNYCDL